MRYFQRMAQGVNIAAIRHTLQRHPELWNAKTFRTTYPHTPHSAIDDILIRFSDDTIAKDDDVLSVMADGNSVWHHPATQVLKDAKPIVLDLMRAVGGYALDRLIITRLAPGKKIDAHADDQGAYVHDPDRERYHVVIQGLPGSLYRNGDETVCMLTGEVWHFNALVEHEITNNSADDRIHMLVDMRIWP